MSDDASGWMKKMSGMDRDEWEKAAQEVFDFMETRKGWKMQQEMMERAYGSVW